MREAKSVNAVYIEKDDEKEWIQETQALLDSNRGRNWLAMLRKRYGYAGLFPIQMDIRSFGSTDGYVGFFEGRETVVKAIEETLNNNK